MLAFVNVFKPAGPTSTQTGARVRRIFAPFYDGKLPVGHLGTLDPAAEGVLPIALGKATRLIPLLDDRQKAYVCTLVLGRSTTTGDALGETVREMPVPANAAAAIERAIPQFLGSIEQIPPMYSAVHHEGRRLYDIARSGETVERAARRVEIHDLRLLDVGCDGENTLRLSVSCGTGTYIRTLCEDLGAAIGTAAHMGALRRERSGPFFASESRTLDEIAADPKAALVAPERVLPLPSIVLDERAVHDFRAGRPVSSLSEVTDDGRVFVYDPSHALLGVGERFGALLAPKKVLA